MLGPFTSAFVKPTVSQLMDATLTLVEAAKPVSGRNIIKSKRYILNRKKDMGLRTSFDIGRPFLLPGLYRKKN